MLSSAGLMLLSAACSVVAQGAGPEKSMHGMVGLYLGKPFASSVDKVHGLHEYGGGAMVDLPVEGVDINQDIAAGINAQYYVFQYLGVFADFMYSRANFPEQEVLLGGWEVSQPRSDVNLYSVSGGPGLRYRGEGFWETFNPYAFAGFVYLFGDASDVNLEPVYGEGGESSLGGSGFTMRLGLNYTVSRSVLTVEYRYDDLSATIDRFRSFEQGLELDKQSSYVFFGWALGF